MSGRCIGFVSSSELLALPREVQLCNILIEGATQLIKWENMMEVGDKAAAEAEIEAMTGGKEKAAAQAEEGADAAGDYPPLGLEKNIKKLPEWIQLGCGDKPYHCPEKNAVFPSDATPAALPDISAHNNCMTDFFKANPDVYGKLKDKVALGTLSLRTVGTHTFPNHSDRAVSVKA